MFRVLIHFYFCFETFRVTFAYESSSCGVMSLPSSLVVGGKLSQREQFPWSVSIWLDVFKGFEYKGTGSLVTSRHVVAAASSVSAYKEETSKKLKAAKPEWIRLYLGTTKYNSTEEPGSIFVDGVKRVVVHPNSKQTTHVLIFDIAVVTMHKTVDFSTIISPVCLWNFNVSIEDQVGQVGYGVGFGSDENRTILGRDQFLGLKKHVPMKVQSMEQCRSFWNESLKASSTSEYFCAKGQDNNSSVYLLDDPFYLRMGERWYLRGLLQTLQTHVNGSIVFDKPVLYEDTGKVFGWIQEQIDDSYSNSALKCFNLAYSLILCFVLNVIVQDLS